jgi:hypothetical protein
MGRGQAKKGGAADDCRFCVFIAMLSWAPLFLGLEPAAQDYLLVLQQVLRTLVQILL